MEKALLWVERYRGEFTDEKWLFCKPLLVKDRAITWMRYSFGEDNLKNWKAECLVDAVYPEGVEAFKKWCQWFDITWVKMMGKPRQVEVGIPVATSRPRAGFYNRIYKR